MRGHFKAFTYRVSSEPKQVFSSVVPACSKVALLSSFSLFSAQNEPSWTNPYLLHHFKFQIQCSLLRKPNRLTKRRVSAKILVLLTLLFSPQSSLGSIKPVKINILAKITQKPKARKCRSLGAWSADASGFQNTS